MIPALASISWVSSPLLVGSGKLGNPCLRRQRANASSAEICAWLRAGVWVGWPPPGSRCRHAVLADWNAGDFAAVELIDSLKFRGELGSGKLGTPCERMHPAKLIASCCAWA